MSTLTYADRNLVAADGAEAKPERTPILARLYNWIIASQQRRAEAEVARYLANRGRLLTDETEREIMRRLSNGRPL
jgi:hypothetical protein